MSLVQNYTRFTTPKGFKLSQKIAEKNKKLKSQDNYKADTKHKNVALHGYIIINGQKRVCRDCQRVARFSPLNKLSLAQPINKEYRHARNCQSKGK